MSKEITQDGESSTSGANRYRGDTITDVQKHHAAIRLDDRRLLRSLAYIDGRWVSGDPSKDLVVTNPATEEVLGHVAFLDAGQIESAIQAADRMFPVWRAMLADERAARLIAWHDLIIANKDDLARLVVLEQGKSLNEARDEIDYGASFVRWFAEEARRAYGDTIPSHIPGAHLACIREPVGVSALITPWNFPIAMITRKASAALAIGCTVIIKPAEETPYSALALAELTERAGFPAGVFNVVNGDAPMVASVICQSPIVRSLSFTGSTRVGRLLLEQSASTVKKCSMELGGNAPFIVLPDVDVERAAIAAVHAKFQTSGQDCLAANRLFVPQGLHSDFLTAFEKYMSALKVGDGMKSGTDLGPLINSSAVSKAQAIVDDAISLGARIVAGDQTARPGPNYFMPTLIAGVTPSMRIFREENFCPVAGVIKYEDLGEVINLANDTEYGLAAYVYGENRRAVSRLIRELEFGMIGVNSVKMTGHPIPFGGMKQSGLGREGSKYGLDDFSEIKYYCLGDLNVATG